MSTQFARTALVRLIGRLGANQEAKGDGQKLTQKRDWLSRGDVTVAIFPTDFTDQQPHTLVSHHINPSAAMPLVAPFYISSAVGRLTTQRVSCSWNTFRKYPQEPMSSVESFEHLSTAPREQLL